MTVDNKLIINGAEENNLKLINVEIPLQKITTIIGVSGSGKSSLIYNVIAAESQRREKIDSGLAECRDYAIRPKFKKIENLPYCVVVKQRGLQQSHSSTLATVTGLHALLRDEFVKDGKIVCQCGTEVFPPTLDDIVGFLEKNHPGKAIELFAIIVHEKYSDCEKEIAILKKSDVEEAIIFSSYNEKEQTVKVKTLKSLNGNYCNTIKIHLGCFIDISFLKKSLETYRYIALESFQVILNTENYYFKYDYICPKCYLLYYPITSSLLSFNAKTTEKISGTCDVCDGHGQIKTLDYEQLIIAASPLKGHFLNLEHNGSCYKYTSLCDDTFARFCKENNIDTLATFFSLKNECQKKIIYYLEEKLLSKSHIKISKFILSKSCPACQGSRLNYKANAVKLYHNSISELLNKTIDELLVFFENKKLHHTKILTTLHSLARASVGYLPLKRTTSTLSGGELQRIKVAIQLNKNFKNLLYILDEPSVGLHAYDNIKFIGLIKHLKNQGNTIIISEHNFEYIKNSDYFIELGVGGGVNGGTVTSCGETNNLKLPILEINRKYRPIDLTNAIYLDQVTCNNIKNQNFVFPLNTLISVSGVSGSGKSSLIHQVLSPIIKQYLLDASINTTYASSSKNIDKIKSLVELDQSQIGINSRSIVATYIGCFDTIRNIFLNTQSASILDLTISAFSFNSEEGQCEYCAGHGEKENIICPSCLGSRYKPLVLDVNYKELSIADVLNLTIDEANLVFKDDSKLSLDLTVLIDLGLGHLTLGRTTPTLSGGEGQRLKLAKSLIESRAKMKAGRFIYILDEPTTGLNYKDINRLFYIFDEILRYNNTIIVIEHNISIIKHSDYIIDMGLGAGDLGGRNVFSGTFNNLLNHTTSVTTKAFHANITLTEQPLLPDISYPQEKLYQNVEYDKRIGNCQKVYISGQSLELEKLILANYTLFHDNADFNFFRSMDDLFSFSENINPAKFFAFNPFVTELYTYRKVAFTDIKNKLLKLSSIGFDKIYVSNNFYSIKKDLKKLLFLDPWLFRIIADDIKQAYNYGNGWLTLIFDDKMLELSTRLVSIINNIIGSPKITTSTFNRYLNPCQECYGTGLLLYIDDGLFIKNNNLSILDEGFLCDHISKKFKSVMKLEIKPAVKKLREEGLFDFTEKFSRLTNEEKNIFLHGFIHKKFLKPKGNKNTKGDYVAWKGIYFYIRDNISQFDKHLGKLISESQKNSDCPFCNGTGFNKELNFFFIGNDNIINFLKNYS